GERQSRQDCNPITRFGRQGKVQPTQVAQNRAGQKLEKRRCAGSLLFSRQPPNPVAVGGIHARRFFLGQDNGAAIILFIPANGVENELLIACTTVFQRLAGNHVIGELSQKAWHQRVEPVGILSICQAVSFQTASERGLIGG